MSQGGDGGDREESQSIPLEVKSVGPINQVTQVKIDLHQPLPQAKVEKSFQDIAWESLVWIIQNPEWLLKWMLTALVIQILFSQGFNFDTLRRVFNLDSQTSGPQIPSP
ncbi:hypothetical protein [Synechococcus sp. PCC 7336]|uniref:hypothetical protein n=1 Tax=Synechococcus sp. PCC 7336 TaxID=195250 RepID=UPI000344A906|nr:hypothetical protein [Synechococcus sp. PCC 7336]